MFWKTPRSQTIIGPAPYSPSGITPSHSRYSSGWSSVRIARRLSRGVERRPLRDGPGGEHAVDLEPQVVVLRGRRVLLDREAGMAALRPCPSLRLAARLAGLGEVALALVLRELALWHQTAPSSSAIESASAPRSPSRSAIASGIGAEPEGQLAAQRDHRHPEGVAVGGLGERAELLDGMAQDHRALPGARGRWRPRARTRAGRRSAGSRPYRGAGSGRSRGRTRTGRRHRDRASSPCVSALIKRRRASGSGSVRGRSRFMNESRLPSWPVSSSRACRHTGHWTRRSCGRSRPPRGASGEAAGDHREDDVVDRDAATGRHARSASGARAGKLVQATSRLGPMCWSRTGVPPGRSSRHRAGGQAHQDPRLVGLRRVSRQPGEAVLRRRMGRRARSEFLVPEQPGGQADRADAVGHRVVDAADQRRPGPPVSGRTSSRHSGRVWSSRSESSVPDRAPELLVGERIGALGASATCQSRSTSGASTQAGPPEPQPGLLDPLAEAREGAPSAPRPASRRPRRPRSGCPSESGARIRTLPVCPLIAADSRRRIWASSRLSRSLRRRHAGSSRLADPVTSFSLRVRDGRNYGSNHASSAPIDELGLADRRLAKRSEIAGGIQGPPARRRFDYGPP